MKAPSLFLRFFRWFCHPSLLKYIEGDLIELYEERVRISGKRIANMRFCIDVLLLFRPGIIRPAKEFSPQNHYGMFKNYLKITWRTLTNSKGYTIINVLGLALGLSATIVILLVVKNELSYDQYHKHSATTYRVTMNALDYNPSVSFAIAPPMRTDFPEMEYVSQFYFQNNALMKVGEDLFDEKDGFAYADENFAKVFDFEWLAGDPQKALKDPNAIVLTESAARKYFASTDVLGKTIRMDNTYDLQVTGLIKDLPSNTHLHFGYLVSWQTVRPRMQNSNFFQISGGYLYVTLPENINVQGIRDRLPEFIRKNWGLDIAKEAKLLLQPLTEIHFDRRYLTQITMPRSKETIYGLAGVGIFIMLTACINFVNLATTQSIKRAKEVGVRKTLGAFRKQVIYQVLTEITVLVTLATIVAIAAVYGFLPSTKALLDVTISPWQLLQPDFLSILAVVLLLTILLAGLYPALVQSRLQPIKALKSNTLRTGNQSFFQKGLVILQFAITQLLLIATIIAGSQMNFFVNQDIGFEKEAIISFRVGKNREVLDQELKKIPGVQQITYASAGPAYNTNFAPFSSPDNGMTESDVTELKMVDENYMGMFELKLLAGDSVRRKNDKDSLPKAIVNETLIRKINITDPEKAIGQKIYIGNTPGLIGGVIADFQSETKHKKIRPLIMFYNENRFWQASVKINPANMRETVASVDKVWRDLNPEWLFSYEFLDEHIAKLYTQEQSTYNTFRLFSVIAIIIGCLGLYGFVSAIAAQRTKEIGIRKVLGASIPGILGLFVNQFIWLIIIAFVIAAPLSWIAMDNWLQEFAYHISISPVIFIISIVTSVLIAALTVSYQTIRAALANPVKSLRTE